MTATMTRRGLAKAAALVAAAGAVPGAMAHAGQGLALTNAATYEFAVGDVRAVVISDGQIAFPAWPTYAPDVPEAAVSAAMRRRFLSPPGYRLDANALLLDFGRRRVLIDTGWGAFAPQVGHLAATLPRAGVTPADIDLIVLSHIHPDHVGGLVGEDGAPAYPNAEVVVAGAEIDQWRDGPQFGAMTVDDGFRPVFAAAADTVLGLGDRLRPIAGAHEIAAGLSLVPLPGHTRGHSGVRVTSGGETLIYAADTFHDQAFDLDHPSWRTAFDHDPPRAAASRRGLLDAAAADRALLMAYHMPFPGLGHVTRTATGYAWTPERWQLGTVP